MQQIRTKWHKLVELAAKNEEIYLTAEPEGVAPLAHDYGFLPDRLAQFLGRLDKLPHFVMDRELVELAKKSEVQKSMHDMKRAGVMKLPYPAMLVEWPGRNPDRHTFTLLRDFHQPPEQPWESTGFLDTRHTTGVDYDFYGIAMYLYTDTSGDYIVLSPSLIYLSMESNKPTLTEAGEPWLRIGSMTNGFFKDDTPLNEPLSKLVEKTYVKDSGSIFYSVSCALLLMATRGMTKEVIDTTRINKKRVANDKPPIPHHTYIRIGKVYRSATSDKADDYVPRRSPFPHWRRGHNRPTRYGPGRTMIKDKYIPPMLVAFYGDGPEPPMPNYRVTK